MTGQHLSEIEIHQYVLDKSHCDKIILGHIASCDHCAAKAANYQLIFSGIKEAPSPVFDFDLSNLVLSRLPKHKQSFSLSMFFIYILSIIFLSVIGVLGYMYHDYLLRIFTSLLPIVMYLIVITAGTVLLLHGLESYRKYRRQMRTLNS